MNLQGPGEEDELDDDLDDGDHIYDDEDDDCFDDDDNVIDPDSEDD